MNNQVESHNRVTENRVGLWVSVPITLSPTAHKHFQQDKTMAVVARVA